MKFHNTAPQVDHFVFTVGHTVFFVSSGTSNSSRWRHVVVVSVGHEIDLAGSVWFGRHKSRHHQASSGSRCHRAGWKAVVKIWVSDTGHLFRDVVFLQVEKVDLLWYLFED